MGRDRAAQRSLLDGRKRGLPRTSRARGNLERGASFGALLRTSKVSHRCATPTEEIVEQIEKVLDFINREGERKLGSLGAAFYALLVAVRTRSRIVGDRRRRSRRRRDE